jgi:hypothetical protein
MIDRRADRLSEAGADEGMLYLDPRARAGASVPTEVGKRFSEVIVFMVGGGCYAEHQNLQDYVAQRLRVPGSTIRSVVYGCSDLVNADRLLDQLQTLSA